MLSDAKKFADRSHDFLQHVASGVRIGLSFDQCAAMVPLAIKAWVGHSRKGVLGSREVQGIGYRDIAIGRFHQRIEEVGSPFVSLFFKSLSKA